MGGDAASTTTTTPVEPGYATTEFWATQAASLLAAIILLLTVFGVITWTEPQKAAVTGLTLIVITVAQGLYALSRGIRKSGQ
jgi:hypothetical protein